MFPIARPAVAALLAILIASPSARAEDTVEQFKTLVEPLLAPATITYAKATATGTQSLVLEDVVLTPPANGPMDKPVSISRVAIDAIDFAGIARGNAPSHLHVRLDGVSSESIAAAPQELTEILGDGPYRANFELDYTIVDARELRIDTLAIELPGFGRLKASLDIDGIESGGGNFADANFDDAALRVGSLSYEDHSLLAKAVARFAEEQHKSEQEIVAEWSESLKSLAASEGHDEGPLLQAALALLADYQAPKGSLTLTLTPPRDAAGAHPIADAATDGVSKTLGVSASYGGQTYALPPDPEAANKRAGIAAWNALVGNTVFAKIDGEEDFDFFSSDGEVRSMEGSDVSRGKWMLEDPKICFQYANSSKECYSLEVIGNSVVFTDEDGTGQRYKILSGNPKQL